MSRLAFLLCLLTVIVSSATALPTISAVGSKFFTSDGKQFFIKGAAYQLTEDDPLIDNEQCRRDASLMKELGANSIRVYHVDAAEDHTDCMKTFGDAGIYLWVDLDSFKTYIKLDVASWTKNKSDSYRQVMDEFQRYDNTAGFFIGNEVLNGETDSPSAPFLLAATADLKAYRKARGFRPIPIGYSATDTDALGTNLQDYVVCRENPLEWLDFYALNSYRWCGSEATFETSGYSILEKAFKGYPIPVFISETGCNTVPPRTFGDQASIFGPSMTDTWSGAIIYEWIQERNKYGLISYGDYVGDGVMQGSTVIDGYRRVGTPTPVAPDFENLKNAWAAATPVGIAQADYSTQTTPRPCPASTGGGWAVDPKAALPTLGDTASLPPLTQPSAGSGSGSSFPSGIPSSGDNPDPGPTPASKKSGATMVQPASMVKLVLERDSIITTIALLMAVGIGATCLL